MSGDDDVQLRGEVGKLGPDESASPHRVASTQERWNERAQAAQEAAQALVACQNSAQKIVASNYFGRGCAEGELLYSLLRKGIVDCGWSELLAEHIAELENLSNLCISAMSAIHEQDISSGQQDFEF